MVYNMHPKSEIMRKLGHRICHPIRVPSHKYERYLSLGLDNFKDGVDHISIRVVRGGKEYKTLRKNHSLKWPWEIYSSQSNSNANLVPHNLAIRMFDVRNFVQKPNIHMLELSLNTPPQSASYLSNVESLLRFKYTRKEQVHFIAIVM